MAGPDVSNLDQSERQRRAVLNKKSNRFHARKKENTIYFHHPAPHKIDEPSKNPIIKSCTVPVGDASHVFSRHMLVNDYGGICLKLLSFRIRGAARYQASIM